ncbi:Hexaprenyldihydroxybenzoate methyltransferase, mitochondrial [Mycoemilia scoparia]|uniref:Ubiquinone biosynthesis O-methyltransferase, mitochondrial n=1 Tax=Mycoemilia scoparia TaxID=417184 RepID=A0A9W8DQ78_9FUNG|nr:Hexaprenyldihydroxybenzoate methyltransferase, mitochondrial [Mycoemilia scoparia]
MMAITIYSLNSNRVIGRFAAFQHCPGISLYSKPYSQSSTKKDSSILPEEVSKFSALSSEWWDPEGPLKTLHQLNPARVSYINKWSQLLRANYRNKTLCGLEILDVGCGGGLLLGSSVTGIDASEESIKIAQMHLKKDPMLTSEESMIQYKCTTAENLAEAKKKFDVVVSSEVIEHVVDPRQFIESITSLVKPGGMVFISTINKTPIAALVDVIIPEYVLSIVPKGTHNYNMFVKPELIRNVLNDLKFQTLDTSGLIYNPLSQVWSVVESDVFGIPNAGIQANYIVCAQKRIDS